MAAVPLKDLEFWLEHYLKSHLHELCEHRCEGGRASFAVG